MIGFCDSYWTNKKKKRLVTVRPSAPWYTSDVVAEKRKREDWNGGGVFRGYSGTGINMFVNTVWLTT